MSYEEALDAMRQGNKVSHQYFTSNEHFEMVRGRVVCEDGYSMAGWYKGEDWQNIGWYIKEVAA